MAALSKIGSRVIVFGVLLAVLVGMLVMGWLVAPRYWQTVPVLLPPAMPEERLTKGGATEETATSISPAPLVFDTTRVAMAIEQAIVDRQAQVAATELWTPAYEAAWNTFTSWLAEFPVEYTQKQRIALIDCFAGWLYRATPPPPAPAVSGTEAVPPTVADKHLPRLEQDDVFRLAILVLGEAFPIPTAPAPGAPLEFDPVRAQPGTAGNWLIANWIEEPHYGVSGTVVDCLPAERSRELLVAAVARYLVDPKDSFEIARVFRKLRWLGDADTAKALRQLPQPPALPPKRSGSLWVAVPNTWEWGVVPLLQFLDAKVELASTDRAALEVFERSFCETLEPRHPWMCRKSPYGSWRNRLRRLWPHVPLAVYRFVFDHPEVCDQEFEMVLWLSDDLTIEEIQELCRERNGLRAMIGRQTGWSVSICPAVANLLFRARDPEFRAWLLAVEPPERDYDNDSIAALTWLSRLAAAAATDGNGDAEVLVRLRWWAQQPVPYLARMALRGLATVRDPAGITLVRDALCGTSLVDSLEWLTLIELAVQLDLRDEISTLRMLLKNLCPEVREAALAALVAFHDTGSRPMIAAIAEDRCDELRGPAAEALKKLDVTAFPATPAESKIPAKQP